MGTSFSFSDDDVVDSTYNLFGSHEYMVLSYTPASPANPNNDTFVLENPWGVDEPTGPIPWSSLSQDCDYYSLASCGTPVPITGPAQTGTGSVTTAPLANSSVSTAPILRASLPIVAAAQPAPTHAVQSAGVDSSLPAMPIHRPTAAAEQPSHERLVNLVLQTHPDWGLY